MLERASRVVFRCFKAFEHAGDAIIGFAGPVFVALAWGLLLTGVVTFFEVIAPTLSLPFFTIPVCLLMALNLLAHYYYACNVAPGFLDDDRHRSHINDWRWAKPIPSPSVMWSEYRMLSEEDIPSSQCRKCQKRRPERAHHCSVCKRCVLKYDHHCPCVSSFNSLDALVTLTDLAFPSNLGINQCVGLHNERHFLLFMAYLVACSTFFVTLGWSKLFDALSFTRDWPYYTTRTVYILIFILALVLGFAVGIMLSWQLWLVSNAETTVENQDNSRYVKIAQSRGKTFINSFDLGRKQNLRLLFNVGPGRYPYYTLFVPLRCEPYSDGWNWARRDGMARHAGIEDDDHMTDDE